MIDTSKGVLEFPVPLQRPKGTERAKKSVSLNKIALFFIKIKKIVSLLQRALVHKSVLAILDSIDDASRDAHGFGQAGVY